MIKYHCDGSNPKPLLFGKGLKHEGIFAAEWKRKDPFDHSEAFVFKSSSCFHCNSNMHKLFLDLLLFIVI